MGETKQPKVKKPSLIERVRSLLGIGLYLMLAGLVLEALTLVIRTRMFFPITLNFEMQVTLTVLCGLGCLSGAAWFSSTLNLVRTYILNGEKRLITEGPFNYVRHPLYATLLITIPPLMIIWFADLLFLLPWALLYLAAHFLVSVEEKGLLETFGVEYKTYQKYVPALIPWKGAGGVRYRAARGNKASMDGTTAA